MFAASWVIFFSCDNVNNNILQLTGTCFQDLTRGRLRPSSWAGFHIQQDSSYILCVWKDGASADRVDFYSWLSLEESKVSIKCVKLIWQCGLTHDGGAATCDVLNCSPCISGGVSFKVFLHWCLRFALLMPALSAASVLLWASSSPDWKLWFSWVAASLYTCLSVHPKESHTTTVASSVHTLFYWSFDPFIS